MREALERQKEFDPTITDGDVTVTSNSNTSEENLSRRRHLRDAEGETTKNEVASTETNSWTEKEEKNKEENVEEATMDVKDTVPVKKEPVPEPASEEQNDTPGDTVEKKEEEEDAERTWRSCIREQVFIHIFLYRLEVGV